MTRARLFVLIDALEEDLRDALRTHVVERLGEDVALGPYLTDARERLLSDPGASADALSEPINYLYLQEAVALLNRHRELLPTDLGEAIRASTPRLDAVAPVRNRVMHGRPLNADDAEGVVRCGNDLLASGVTWPNVSEVLGRLNADPAWEPAYMPEGPLRERVLHNLPMPDFDETGLVGRGREVRTLLGFLIAGRHDVLTVVGEGGVGKTALVVKALYDLIDHPTCPYEAVLWTSLKTEALTTEGVQVLTDTARGLPGITRGLASPLDESYEGTITQLGELLGGTKALVVIDNLETANADEILEVYDAMPPGTKFLFTSRIGLGQLERRVPLGPLNIRDASSVFRRLSRQRNLEYLSTLADDHVSGIVSALRRNPLAIRWYVQSIEAGHQPDLALHNQDELLEFCVKSVFSALPQDAKNLLIDVFCLDRPVLYSELAVLANLDLDRLRAALHDLQRASLVDIDAAVSDRVAHGYSLTTSVRQYIARISPPDPSRAREMCDRDNQLRTREELRRRRAARDALAPHVCYTRSELDIPVADVLTEALDLAHGDDEAWRHRIATAEQLAPSFYEVARVNAFIESTRGNIGRATTLYERALDQADPEYKPIVSYFFAGHLARSAKDPQAALKHAKCAHENLHMPRATLQYGLVMMYLERFDEADDLIRQVATETDGRVHLIAVTQLVSLARRRSEWLCEHGHNPVAAFEMALGGAREGMREMSAGVSDGRLAEAVVHTISGALFAARTIASVDEIEADLLELVRYVNLNRGHWKRLKAWPQCETNLERLALRDDVNLESGLHVADSIDVAIPQGERITGRVLRFFPSRGFGFVRPNGLDLLEVFLPAAQLRASPDRVFLTAGAEVEFTLGANDQGPCATNIDIPPREQSRLLEERRIGEVKDRFDEFGFIRDRLTGGKIYISKIGLDPSADWTSLVSGTEVSYFVEMGSQGPRVRRGSAQLEASRRRDGGRR
jgi:cold shock CspA family protein